MTVQAWFEQGEATIRPGEALVLGLRLEHLGDEAATYVLIPTGINTPWIRIEPASVTLRPHGRAAAEVTFASPRAPTTTAGPATIAIRVASEGDPEDVTVVETTVEIATFDDRRISLLQPVRRARRRTTFELLVENHGNALASCRLHLIDPTGRVDGEFDPPALGVPPGSVALTHLRARVQGSRWRTQERHLDIGLEATESGHPPAQNHATLIQPPTVSGRAVVRVLATAAVLAAVVASWFGVVRPEIRDAARQAVTEELDAATGPAATVPSDQRPDGQENDPGVEPGVDLGEGDPGTGPTLIDRAEWEPITERLVVRAAAGATGSASFEVPTTLRLEVTDVVLQNLNGDLGIATLAVDDAVLYEWDLGLMPQVNEFQPRITPIPVPAGASLVLRVRCEEPADVAGGCEIAVLVSGRQHES